MVKAKSNIIGDHLRKLFFRRGTFICFTLLIFSYQTSISQVTLTSSISSITNDVEETGANRTSPGNMFLNSAAE